AGARADDAHLAEQHVPELGQLVDVEAAEPAADEEDARVILHLELRAVNLVADHELAFDVVGVENHGAELPALEVADAAALADGAVEARARAVERDGQRHPRA